MGIKADIFLKEDSTHPWQETVSKRMRGAYDTRGHYIMHEDDMSFMKEVFMPDDQGNEKPRLPYNKYIVEWGYHGMCKDLDDLKDAPDPNGALAKMREKYGESFQCVYKLPRPDGTKIKVSVISGMMFYSRKDAPYEVMVYDGSEDPYAYQTDEDLMLLLAKLLGEGETNEFPR